VEKRRDLERMGDSMLLIFEKREKEMAAGSASGNRILFLYRLAVLYEYNMVVC
jgi:hypothetical protein